MYIVVKTFTFTYTNFSLPKNLKYHLLSRNLEILANINILKVLKNSRNMHDD